MNGLLCRVIDYYVLCNIHRVKSTKPHFFDMQSPEFDFNEFWTDPNIPDITFTANSICGDYESGKYIFKSLISNEHEKNNTCFGEYYKNEKKINESVSVILVHGWRSGNNSYMSDIYLKSFMDKKYNIYTYTLPYHFERSPENSYNGEYMITANINRTLTSINQSVTDLRALILYLKHCQKDKVILIGNSLGGLVTNMTTVLEKNIDILISILYANSLPFSVWNTIVGKYVKKDFLVNSAIQYEELKKKWSLITPSNFKPAVSKENILLISGKHDLFVLEEDTKKLWESWDKPKRLLYKCGHAGIVFNKKDILNDSMDFINKRL